jgi:hypothetical protein
MLSHVGQDVGEHLHFNQKIYCVEGFKDLGSHGRTSGIANCALVFMLHGLHKKWRVVTYYLICGSTEGEMVINFLMPLRMQD